MAQSKSFFDDVKKEIECPVCQEQFSETKEPKILKCFHTFCKSCLEGWLRQQSGGALSCPKCRRITECRNDDINSLPSNLFYKQMVDIVEAYSAQGQEDSPYCGNCDERKSLKFYCADCNHFLCEDCAGAHKKMKTLSGHQVKEIGNFKASDARDYARRANACKQHNDEVRFFCEQCKTCICRDCAILDHEDHKKMSLERGLEKKKSEIQFKLREVQVNGSRLSTHKESLEKRRLKVNNCFEQATKEVREAAECCINFIRRYEESVTKRLMKQKESFADEFVNQMTNVDGKLAEIGSCLEFGDEVLSRNNLPEILNVEEMLEKRLQELSIPFEPMLNFPEVRYTPNDMSSLTDALGNLHTTNTEPSLSVAEGQGLTEAIQGVCGTFTVITKDAHNQTTYSDIDEIEVTILSEEKETLKTNVTDCKNGQYLVKYKSDVGGDFNVSISVRGQAIMGSPFNLAVAKKTTKVVKTVLQTKQELNGVALIVKPYEESMEKDNCDYEVFELVSAELCLETVEILTRGQTKTLLDKLAGKTGIKWIEVSDTFTMSGNFKQVELSRTYLQQAIHQSGGMAVFSRLERKMTQPPKRDEDESQFGRDESDGGLKQASSTAIAVRNGVNHQDQGPKRIESSHVTSVTPPAIQNFEVEPKFIRVFVKAHKTDIEAQYKVEVPREAKGGKISLIPNDGCSSEEYEKACDLFIDLYQQMTLAMKMERFSLSSEKNIVPARKKIREMSKTFPVSVELAKDQKHWELYGEQRDLEAALEFLRKEEIEIKRESGKDKGTGEFQVSRHDENAMDLDPQDSSEGSQSKDKLETYIGGVKVSVYKGDLTSERVDVIVNAANNRLRHEGGVAKAIIDKGGKVIEVESNTIMAKRRTLKDGEAVVTNSGFLPCKKVVHAVGPVFRDVGLSQSRYCLRRACLNSLNAAQEYISIALPAIGYGAYGMPKDECAKVMFDAVGEFVKQGNPKKKKITDIRFVNIDDPTYQAFRNEFISRYGNNQEHSRRSDKRPPDGAEGATNSRPSSSWANRGKGKSKHSSGNSQPSTRPGNVVSIPDQNASGSSDATNDHPFSNFNLSSLSNTSYSAAVKNNTGGGTETRSPTALEPGGAGKKGYYPHHLATMDRKDEDSATGGGGSSTKCPICLDTLTNARTLKCKHVFCTDCVETALKHDNRCPVCKEVQGVMRGNQPAGQMQFQRRREHLPGYNDCGTIVIDYYFPPGTQGKEHPNPGQWYNGTQRNAYLPDNREGNEVLHLLRRAFDARLVFTVGTSVAIGMQNQITWNDIHHKTSIHGGPQGFGYPDPDYLRRVKEDLAAKGIR